MDIKKFRDKLQRYLNGNANETESAIVEAWYKSYHADEELQINAVDKARIKQAISQKISAVTIRRKKLYRNNYGIAASFLLISGWAVLYYRSHSPTQSTEIYTTVHTKAGQIRQLTLPDSSVIWLNSLSRVRIPLAFNDSVRTVLLDEGEAFFEVKHNASKPFRVTTPALQVQVLGTSFDVSAYKNLKHTSVAVATGKVGVIASSKTLSMLTPGQQLMFNDQSKTYTQTTIDIRQSYSWKDGDTYLKQASFSELAVIIKNIYGIDLKAATPVVAKYQFTLRLQRRMPVDEALKVISTIHNTHFRKEGNKVILY